MPDTLCGAALRHPVGKPLSGTEAPVMEQVVGFALPSDFLGAQDV